MATKQDYEFAAKAMGGLVYVEGMGWIEEDENGNRGKWWNPEGDDGDSRRLAVKLNMGVQSNGEDHWQSPNCTVVLFGGDRRLTQPHVVDALDATRLAVFRAAVEVGRAMP